MTSQSQADQSLEALRDIKRMMERSSRFISLSGLSGLSAGICALIGAWFAHNWIADYYGTGTDFFRGAVERLAYIHVEASDFRRNLIALSTLQLQRRHVS